MVVPLVIYGAGNPEVVKLLAAINRAAPTWRLLGFIDDTPEKQGCDFMGFPILGPGTYIASLDLSSIRFYNNVAASTAARRRVSQRMAAAGCQFATLIHPSVDTAFTRIGQGTSIGPWVSVGANTILGEDCAVRQLTNIGHETRVEDHVFIGPGVIIAGRVTIESGAYIGADSTILEALTIGRDSVVGAGAVVVRDVPPGVRVVGVPARETAPHGSSR